MFVGDVAGDAGAAPSRSGAPGFRRHVINAIEIVGASRCDKSHSAHDCVDDGCSTGNSPVRGRGSSSTGEMGALLRGRVQPIKGSGSRHGDSEGQKVLNADDPGKQPRVRPSCRRPHLNAEVAVTLLMATRQSERVALFFQTAAGTAIDFWDGPDSMFERRVLRGKNPFQVTPSIQIITYARRADDRWAVYCVTSNWSSTAEDDELRRLIRNLFPSGAIDIVVGDSPFYLEATSHLLLYPIHGWTPIPDLRAVRTRRLVLEPSRWARDQSSFSDAERGKTRNRKLTPR